jgi:DNA-binding FadR family transcriptional regulator
VGKAESATLGRSLALHMHLVGATYDELLDAWVECEAVLAEMAAKNPDRDRVRRLMSPYVESDVPAKEGKHAIDEGFNFHGDLAALAGNRVFAYMLRMPGSIVSEHILTTVSRHALEDQIVHDHVAIAKAVIAGNAKKARETSRQHIHRVAEYFRAYWPLKVGEKIRWR